MAPHDVLINNAFRLAEKHCATTLCCALPLRGACGMIGAT
jgi:hypothetical protein